MATPAQIEAAIVVAVRAGSGLADGRVLWSFQDASEPALAYIAMSLSEVATEGQDSVLETYDGARPSGQEYAEQILGVRELVLQLQAFTGPLVSKDSPAAVTGRELLEAVRSKLLLPSVREPLAAVGFVPFDPGPIGWVPSVVNAGFRGRATCDIRCRMPAQSYAEFTTYIAEVRGTFRVTLDAKSPGSPLVIPFDWH